MHSVGSAVGRGIFAALTTLALGAFVSVASAQDDAERNAAAAGGMCIPNQAEQSVTTCPSNAPARTNRPAPSGEAPTSRLRAAVPEQEESAASEATRGPSVELDLAAAANRQATEQRAWQLLRRELQLVNRIIGRLDRSDRQRPQALLRKANTLFEMQQALNARVRGLDEPLFEACPRQRGEEPSRQCRGLREQQTQARDAMRTVSVQAVETYRTLVMDHPQFRGMDEVLFSWAFGLDELASMAARNDQWDEADSRRSEARSVYRQLIKRYPDSRYVPHAWLSFAEFYFNDGDMDVARRMYEKVLEFPPPENRVYGFAVYKQAWVHFNLENFRESLASFVATIEFATENPDASDATNLANSARRELVMPYARVGRPSQAMEFFGRFARNREETMTMLESLAEIYFDTGQWTDTIEVYQNLMAENSNDDKICYWQSRVTNAIISSSTKPQQVRELQRMIDVWEAFSAQDRSAEVQTECKSVTAGLLVWLATAWHREAIGSDAQPGTNDQATMNLAAELYRLILEKFPDMEQLEFPDIDRRDWPTEYRVSYYYAELLWKMEDWTACGPAFDNVVELDPQGEYTSDAALAAVLCYNNLYQQQYAENERAVRSSENSSANRRQRRGRRGRRQQEAPVDDATRYQPREFTELENGMLNAYQRYVCFVPDSEDLATIKYRQARIYYEANRYEEAAVLFKDIAWNHRDSDLAIYAANLYLDSLNVIGTQWTPNRTQCIDSLEESIEPLWGFYCENTADYETNEELCRVLEQLRCDVLRKRAEANQTNGNYETAARNYVRIFRSFRECGQLDEVLWNAAINFEAARLIGSSIRVRNALVAQFPDSELSKRAIYLIGANYQAIAAYERAAEYYEQFAERYPREDGANCSDEDRESGTCAVAYEALRDAIFFRMGLGRRHHGQAVENAALFERNYGRSQPRVTSQVVFAIGDLYRRQRRWDETVRHFRGYTRRFQRTGYPHQIIEAHVAVGKAYWEQDDLRRARSPFEAAVSAWESAPEAIAAMEGSDATKARYLALAKMAVSEALFHLAEYKFQAFQAIEFPAFQGERTLEGVNEWAQGDFMEWVQEKNAARIEAEAAYNRVAELEMPPWMIASAARIGEMYRTFVDQFRDAPIPEAIEEDPELRDIYYGALDEQSQPLVVQAIQKFQFCLNTSTQVRWFNEYSQQCEQELNRLEPAQYPLAAELRTNASLQYSRPAELQAIDVDTSTGEDETGGGSDESETSNSTPSSEGES